MKSTLIVILILGALGALTGQESKISISLEYSPNFSRATERFGFSNEGFRLSHNMFLKGGYALTRNLHATAGFGYLNAREFDQLNLGGQLEIDLIESVRTHHYLAFPIGFRYHFGSFYIHPEIGLSVNFDNTTQQTSFLSNGTISRSRFKDTFNYRDVNKITVPAFFTIGNEIDLGYCSVIMGIKGYYSLNKISEFGFQTNHHYGFGVVTGVKF